MAAGKWIVGELWRRELLCLTGRNAQWPKRPMLAWGAPVAIASYRMGQMRL